MRLGVLSSLLGLALLAGCGVDGAPVPPDTKDTGLGLSGTIEVGVAGGS